MTAAETGAPSPAPRNRLPVWIVVARLLPSPPAAARFPAYVSTFGLPDWLIMRAEFPKIRFDLDAFFAAHDYPYRRHKLPVPDALWNNRPYPPLHRHRSPGQPLGEVSAVVQDPLRS